MSGIGGSDISADFSLRVDASAPVLLPQPKREFQT
jgi:hypothetical protein